ncbi:MAG TPA: HAMP domain-containing sensor histidine kinase [Acidimicrobiales bacterium]|nr:HAMP domain-containing sensor histidine kinase [Acidimicrobiales bacterium]
MADRNLTILPLAEAAGVLGLPPAAVVALVDAGYLTSDRVGSDGPRFRLADLKAFVARNSGTEDRLDFDASLDERHPVDPQELLDALDGRAPEMAERVFAIFSTVFAEAREWAPTEQARFIEQARSRFEAILAVAAQGAEVDEALVGDLQEVGAQAARSTAPLPQLLVILRISRDLVVQTAVELAEAQGRHWGLALSLLLTRILPAMDRLTDALAQGYWSAMLLGRPLEAHDLLLSPRPVNLAGVVAAAVQSRADAAGVETAVADDLVVLADARRLEQVVANLIDNATAHGAPPVAVTAQAAADAVVLTVADHGAGVPEALVPTLFSGVRLLGSPHGTGPGLALVRSLVEAMGGRVWYQPGAGGGAEFCLGLPVPPGQR